MLYLCYFYYYALRGILREQNICLPTEPIPHKKNFRLTQSIYLKWRKLFGCADKTNQIPFTYYYPENVKFFLKTMDELRLNYRNILHLGHEVTFFRDPKSIQLDESVSLIFCIKDIALLDHNRAVLFIESIIEDTTGNKICQSMDSIYLKRLSESDKNKIKKSPHYQLTDMAPFKNLSKQKPQLIGSNVEKNDFYVPKHFGLQYGKISGDLNPVHTQGWLAKLFGYPRAFIQGSATLNFLLKCIVDERQDKFNYLNIIFCRPIYLEQTIEIRFQDENFELVNSNNELLAYGKRYTQSAIH